MLYPLTIASQNSTNTYRVNSGSLWAFPFTIGTGDIFQLSLIHTGIGIEDFSLRAWVSNEPGGMELKITPGERNFWPVGRLANDIFTVFDGTTLNPLDITAPHIGLTQGLHYVNVLNLINLANSFMCTLTPMA